MSHFAKVVDGVVATVIVAEQDFIDTLNDGVWVQTSYNTRGNVHYSPTTGLPDGGQALRGNYAAPGFIYDEVNDVFYPPQRYASWSLNQETWTWDPPVPYPTDGETYTWDEATLSWVMIVAPETPPAP